MRPDSLRPATARAAARATGKLETCLSKGEKRNRKRLAEVGAVYDLTPAPRTTADIITGARARARARAPVTRNKWLTASVVEDAAQVLGGVFAEADRATPDAAAPGSRSSTATTTRSSGSPPKPAPERYRSRS